MSFSSLSLSLYIYIYIYICISKARKSDSLASIKKYNIYILYIQLIYYTVAVYTIQPYKLFSTSILYYTALPLDPLRRRHLFSKTKKSELNANKTFFFLYTKWMKKSLVVCSKSYRLFKHTHARRYIAIYYIYILYTDYTVQTFKLARLNSNANNNYATERVALYWIRLYFFAAQIRSCTPTVHTTPQ